MLRARSAPRCEELGHAVTWIDADIQTLAQACPDGAEHDLYILGSWSINAGRTPPEMKRFIEQLVAAVGKPERLAVFGTGETQWGEENYCGAAPAHRSILRYALPAAGDRTNAPR